MDEPPAPKNGNSTGEPDAPSDADGPATSALMHSEPSDVPPNADGSSSPALEEDPPPFGLKGDASAATPGLSSPHLPAGFEGDSTMVAPSPFSTGAVPQGPPTWGMGSVTPTPKPLFDNPVQSNATAWEQDARDQDATVIAPSPFADGPESHASLGKGSDGNSTAQPAPPPIEIPGGSSMKPTWKAESAQQVPAGAHPDGSWETLEPDTILDPHAATPEVAAVIKGLRGKERSRARFSSTAQPDKAADASVSRFDKRNALTDTSTASGLDRIVARIRTLQTDPRLLVAATSFALVLLVGAVAAVLSSGSGAERSHAGPTVTVTQGSGEAPIVARAQARTAYAATEQQPGQAIRVIPANDETATAMEEFLDSNETPTEDAAKSASGSDIAFADVTEEAGDAETSLAEAESGPPADIDVTETGPPLDFEAATKGPPVSAAERLQAEMTSSFRGRPTLNAHSVAMRKKLRKQLFHAYHNRHYKSALAFGRKLDTRYGLDWEAEYITAHAARIAGEKHEAFRRLETFALKHQDNLYADDAVFWMGKILMNMGQPRDARYYFQRVAEDPNSDWKERAARSLAEVNRSLKRPR